MQNDPQRPILSVSELLRSVRDTLERRFPLLWVRGELSNLNYAASGHCYFTLKDRGAQVGRRERCSAGRCSSAG